MTLDIPPGVAESQALIARFDRCLLEGFSRLGVSERAALDDLAAVYQATPLERPVSDAVAAIGRSEFLPAHFVALAAARCALLGAQYDALLEEAAAHFGFSIRDVAEAAAMPPSGSTLLAAVQAWLLEIALGGLGHLEEEAIAPFASTVASLAADPALSGIAVLLTGFVNELLACVPTSRQVSLPLFRWADLWSAAFVRTQHAPAMPTFETVKGQLIPFGLDVQRHENFVSASLFGILQVDGAAPQTVRAVFSGFKVDLLEGAEIWDLFEPHAEPLLKALEEHRRLVVNDAELYSNGDLVLLTAAALGTTCDPFDFTEQLTGLPTAPAALRHPVHLSQIVHLALPSEIAIATERLKADADVNEKALGSAKRAIGILRFDGGGWRLQPICVRTPKGFICEGQGLRKIRAKKKTATLEQLRERASRLLRG